MAPTSTLSEKRPLAADTDDRSRHGFSDTIQTATGWDRPGSSNRSVSGRTPSAFTGPIGYPHPAATRWLPLELEHPPSDSRLDREDVSQDPLVRNAAVIFAATLTLALERSIGVAVLAPWSALSLLGRIRDQRDGAGLESLLHRQQNVVSATACDFPGVAWSSCKVRSRPKDSFDPARVGCWTSWHERQHDVRVPVAGQPQAWRLQFSWLR